MQPFKNFVFGDYSGLREFHRDRKKFLETYIEPTSIQVDNLRNDRNFVLVGKKGVGKSSCCLALASRLKDRAFKSTFYNFSEDLSRSDLKEAVQTQSLNLKDISTKKLFDSIVEFYDFRDLWTRKVLHSIASSLASENTSSHFTRFALSTALSEASISEGVGRGLDIVVPDTLLSEFRKLVPSLPATSKMPLREYNRACMSLLAELHHSIRYYFFFDELNLSHTKSDSSEYTTLLALIRDIVRTAAKLNDFFVEKGMNVHIICSLRPEVRNEVVQSDVELGKTIESNTATIFWPAKASDENPLLQILRNKLRSSGVSEPDLDLAIPKEVRKLGENGSISFPMFMLNITWYRPRDIIRALKCFQDTNGNETVLFAPTADMNRFMKEYSRVSKQDCLAELDVKYSRKIIEEALSRIKRPTFRNLDDLLSQLEILTNRIDVKELARDFFDAGVISNHEKVGGTLKIYASYRGDSEIDSSLRIIVHRGLQGALQLGFSPFDYERD